VKVKERFPVCKQARQKFYMRRFNLKRLTYEGHKGQFHVKILNSLPLLEDLKVLITIRL